MNILDWEHPAVGSVESLIPAACQTYRNRFFGQLRRFMELTRLRGRLTTAEARTIDYWLAMEDRRFIEPIDLVLRHIDVLPINLVAVVLHVRMSMGERVLAIAEDHARRMSVEGVGKSALGLRLMGIEVNASLIPRPAGREDSSDIHGILRQLRHFRIPLRAENDHVRLVASDMPYLAVADGRLVVLPVAAEPMIAVWDVARSLSRHLDRHYRVPLTNRKVAHLMDFVERLAETISIPFGDPSLFQPRGSAYPVDDFIFFRRVNNARISSAKLTRLSDATSTSWLWKQLAANPLYLYERTRFWQIDRWEHHDRVAGLRRAMTNPPAVWSLVVHSPGGAYPLDEAADAVTRALIYHSPT